MRERIAALSKMQSGIGDGSGGNESDDADEADDNGYGQYLTDLDWAKQANELGLSAEAKKLVSNSAELEGLWKAAFAAEKTLATPSDERWADFICKGKGVAGLNMQAEVKPDEIYGKVWAVTRKQDKTDIGNEDVSHKAADYDYKTELAYAKTLEESEKTALIEGYACVKFFVYVKHALAKNEESTLYFTLPGEKYDKSTPQERKEVPLEIGAWTEITLTSEEFKKFGRMTFGFAVLAEKDVGYDYSDELKISPFYGFN